MANEPAKGRIQGTVLEYDQTRGIGMIESETGEAISFHKTALGEGATKGLYPGDVVEFKVGRNRFGRRAALEITLIGWEESDSDSPGEWTF